MNNLYRDNGFVQTPTKRGVVMTPKAADSRISERDYRAMCAGSRVDDDGRQSSLLHILVDLILGKGGNN